MPALHIVYPHDYESCPKCAGTGTVAVSREGRYQRIACDNPGCHSGSIRKWRHATVDPGPEPNSLIPSPPVPMAEDLKIHYESASNEAATLKKRLLEDILSSSELSTAGMLQAHGVIEAIDPSTGTPSDAVKVLLQEWGRQLPANHPLLGLLASFETLCFRVETYRHLYEHRIS
jgi:hypothetical protein